MQHNASQKRTRQQNSISESLVSQLFIFLVLVCCVILPGLVSAEPEASVNLTDEERAWLTDNPEKLALWFNDSFPPLEYSDTEGNFIGLGADIVWMVEQRLGIKFRRRVCTDWNRHLKALESGECAVAPTIVENLERSRYAFFSSSYAQVPAVIIAPRNPGTKLALEDLSGRKVAVVAGFVTETYARNFKGAALDVVTVPDVSQGLRAVAFGQVDAFIENLAVASYYIGQHGITNLKVVGTTDYNFVFTIAVSRHYPLLYSALQKAMNSIKPGEYAEARNRWITLRIDRGISPEKLYQLKIVALFISALIFGLSLMSILLKRNLNDKIARLQAAQEESAQNEIRFRSLFTQAPMPLIELDGDRLTSINKCFTDTFGYTLKDIPVADAWWPLVYPDPEYREKASAAWQKALEKAPQNNNIIEPEEFTIRCKNGEKVTLMIGASIIGNRTLISFFNISEMKKMQKELLASLQRFETLFESAPYPCAISDLNGYYIMVNQRFCRLTGRSAPEILGKKLFEIEPFPGENYIENLNANILKSGFYSEEITSTVQGQKLHLIYISKSIELDGRKLILSSTIDISIRRQAEEALRQNEENLRVTLNSIADAVIATDMQGNISRINQAAQGLTGWTTQEATGRRLSEVFRILDPDTHTSLEHTVINFSTVSEAATPGGVILLTSRDGRERLVNYSVTRIKNDAGNSIGMVLVFRDVTEEHILQEQLRHSQKMDAIGKLAGGVAHDFNNMLGGIIGAAELMKTLVKDDDAAGKYLKMILDASERAAQLTSRLLAFARRQPVISSPLNLIAPLNEAVDLLQRTVDRRVRIEKNYSVEQLIIIGDFSQLQSAFLNLLINASQAMAEGGTIFISVRKTILDSTYCDASPFSLKPGDFAEIEIRDTGCGIPRENLQRIFEPFFTTKGQGKGTGLGLSAVFGTMQQHGGAININSEQGHGTNVHVLLPLSPDAKEIVVPEMPQPIKGSGKILIIDDEPMMRVVAGGILEDLGYEILTADNGRQGLETFTRHCQSISLVILDMVMPEMNGKECFFAMKKVSPDLRVVISSGFTRDEDLEEMKAAGASWFIRKPFRITELSQIIHNALEA